MVAVNTLQIACSVESGPFRLQPKKKTLRFGCHHQSGQARGYQRQIITLDLRSELQFPFASVAQFSPQDLLWSNAFSFCLMSPGVKGINYRINYVNIIFWKLYRLTVHGYLFPGIHSPNCNKQCCQSLVFSNNRSEQ